MQPEVRPNRTGRESLLVRLILFISLALFTLRPASIAQQSNSKEYQVKAAYLYNFAKLAEWPKPSLPDGPSPLVIGVLGGDDEFVNVLVKTVAGRTIQTHPLAAKLLASLDDVKSCHIVFFRSSEGKRTTTMIAALGRGSILLVGEDQNFLRQGGMINLTLENGKIRFELNRDAMDLADLQFSPQLLLQAKADHGSSISSPGARRLKSQAPPEYPELAQRMKIKGMVHVLALVRPDGSVKEVRVTGGHPVLAQALVRAVMEWRYEPTAKETTEPVMFDFGRF